MATFTTRPVIMGNRGVVTAGHYLVAIGRTEDADKRRQRHRRRCRNGHL